MAKSSSKKSKAAKPKKAKVVKETDGMAVASLVCGILCFIIPILNIVAIVLGVMALNNIKKNPCKEGRGLAIAGVVLGSISLLLAFLLIIFVFSVVVGVLSIVASSVA